MDLVEIKQQDRVQREEAAARLRQLADQLSRHNDVEFERDGSSFKVHVPDEVQLKVELEIGDDGSELRSSSPGSPLPPGGDREHVSNGIEQALGHRYRG